MEVADSRTDNRDDKENMVSSSPDSGICDVDTKSENQNSVGEVDALPKDPLPRNRSQCTLDPFFYKYADNRKLTLLKSLSQDSEYSLDTSLFDAEEFLQDMGFAGGSDPTIPDRFLPSLLQRLSKFPESEMDGLHERIVQSIGCFRRKEGKRRLFRNLSMGKDSRMEQYGRNRLISPPNNYPLLRSNTGPAAFPFEETDSEANNSLHKCRLSSNDSGNYSLDSLKAENEIPESPIAILISSDSVEQYEKRPDVHKSVSVQVSLPSGESFESEDSTDSTQSTTSSDISNFSPSNRKQRSDREVIDIVAGLQKLTNDISENESSSHNERMNDSKDIKPHNVLLSSESSDSDYVITSSEFNAEVSESNKSSERNQSPVSSSRFHDFPKQFVPETTNKSPPIKQPLRRLSNAQNYSLEGARKFGSFEHQSKIDDDDDTFDLVTGPLNQHFIQNKDNSFDNNINNINENSHGIFDSVFSESAKREISLNGAVEFETSKNPISYEYKYKESDSSTFNKPVYSRDDSLTNFLSSMLDTSENESSLKISASPQNSISKNAQCKSFNNETSHQNLSSGFFSVNRSNNELNAIDINEIHNEIHNAVPFTESVKPNIIFDNEMKSKRNFFRRMSSSLPGCDDQNSEESDGCNPCLTVEDSHSTIKSPFDDQLKLSLRTSKSEPQNLNNNLRCPCRSLSELNLCGICKTPHDEIANHNNVFNMQRTMMHSSSDPAERKGSIYRRKTKRTCERCKYATCSTSRACLNFSTIPDTGSCSKYCNSITDECPCHKYDYDLECDERDTFKRKLGVSKSSSFCEIRGCGHLFQRRHIADPPSVSQCPCSEKNRNTSQMKNSTHSFRNINFNSRHYLFNSAPDIRNVCDFSTPEDNFILRHRNSFENLCSVESTPFCRTIENDRFLPDSGQCSCFYYDHNGLQQDTREVKFQPTRLPSNQNSLSFQDSENLLLNSKRYTDDHFSSNSFHNSNICPEMDIGPNSMLTFGSSMSERERISLQKGLEILSSPENVDKLNCTDSLGSKCHRSSAGRFESEVEHSPYNVSHPTATNNKSEAQCERKIRIFSKFLTNLGNLAKSNKNTYHDKKHKSRTDRSFCDVRDKVPNSEALSDFCALPAARKCVTPPGSLDNLFDLLESMDSNKVIKSAIESPKELNSEKNSSVSTVNEFPVYENKVLLQASSDVGERENIFQPVVFTSSVSMYIHSDDTKEVNLNRKEEATSRSHSEEDEKCGTSLPKEEKNLKLSMTQMPFKGVSKDLEDLQLSIQKAKEMRISASKELHILQELLARDNNGENFATKKDQKLSLRCAEKFPKDTVFRRTEMNQRHALMNLREKSKKDVLEDTSFWQEEIRKVRLETNQAWQAKLDRMEERLAKQEEELRQVQSDNENLQKHLELRTLGSPTCLCKSDGIHNGFGRIDSAFEDDEEYYCHKPSTPIQSMRQECDRLQERLQKEKQTTDELNLLLNQKILELNKVQLALSKQTKEMIELEKSYLQLQCRQRRGTSKPMVARICSRTSPFSSKNLCPKPSPPASPLPTSIS